MTDEPLTVQILKDICAELRSHGDELRLHTERFEQLERRQVATEIRLATELTSVVGAIHELRDVIVADRSLRTTVTDHEQRISAIESRLKA